MLAGNEPPASRLIVSMGIESLFRLQHEPVRRIKRIFRNCPRGVSAHSGLNFISGCEWRPKNSFVCSAKFNQGRDRTKALNCSIDQKVSVAFQRKEKGKWHDEQDRMINRFVVIPHKLPDQSDIQNAISKQPHRTCFCKYLDHKIMRMIIASLDTAHYAG